MELTPAGAELLQRARSILSEVEVAEHSVHLIADGVTGTVRLAIAPPAAPVLVPHLLARFSADAPQVRVDVRRMWLPDLMFGLASGKVDAAISGGLVTTPDEIASTPSCAEHLLVGLRADHRSASQNSVSLRDLEHEVLGMSSESLFPAWVSTQRRALEAANVSPPAIELEDADLAASRWVDQADVDWVLLISSLTCAHTGTVILPVTPAQTVPFSLHWVPSRARASAVERFVNTAKAAGPPSGWIAL